MLPTRTLQLPGPCSCSGRPFGPVFQSHRPGPSQRRSLVARTSSAPSNGSPPSAETTGSEPSTSKSLAEGLAKATTAAEKLELLKQLQQRSTAAARDASMSTFTSGAPRLVDARMYHNAVEAQRRMSEKLSDANNYIAFLEEKVKDTQDDLEAASAIFKKVSMEFGTTGRLADAAVAAVKFGVDKTDSIAKIGKLRERLDALEKAMQREREDFGKRVPRQVPVTWVGAASEVRLVGDFDGWTRGVDLSAPDGDSGDSVLRTFEATVPLLPGQYRVKFLVDGEWRLAPEWPMENNEVGETNNVLEVK